MEITSMVIAESLIAEITRCIQLYTYAPGIRTTCEALEKALKQRDYDTTLFMCEKVNNWYENNIKAICSNNAVFNKYEHVSNIDSLKSVTEAFHIHAEWFDALDEYSDTTKRKMIFVSHSSADEDAVKALVILLRDMGLDESNLFCSSYPGFGIPLGKNIFDFLRHCFDDYELYVLFLISKDNYYASAACLNEMGAAWVCGVQYDTILLPGMSPDKMRGAVGSERIAIVLDGPDARYRLNDLRDNVTRFLGINVPVGTVWESDRDRFLGTISSARSHK